MPVAKAVFLWLFLFNTSDESPKENSKMHMVTQEQKIILSKRRLWYSLHISTSYYFFNPNMYSSLFFHLQSTSLNGPNFHHEMLNIVCFAELKGKSLYMSHPLFLSEKLQFFSYLFYDLKGQCPEIFCFWFIS